MLRELHKICSLSNAVDTCSFIVDAVTASPALLANSDKFVHRLFAKALHSKPSDCLSLLQLACAGSAPLPLLEKCLGHLDHRFCFLVDVLTRHLSAIRAGQPLADSSVPSLQQAARRARARSTSRCSTACAGSRRR